MFACEMCGREFKNRSGLSGHKRMIHYSESTSEHSTRALGEHSRSASASTVQLLQERLEHHDEVLGNVLQRLDQLLGSEVLHPQDSNCSGCQEMRQEIHQARVAGINEIAEIPGVKDAVAFASSTERWNEENPDHAIDKNWASVPGVRDLIENSQPKLIHVTSGEESPPSDGVIRVVRAPEGDLLRGEMIKAEVKRNAPAMIKAAAQQQVGGMMTTAEVERKLGKKIYSR